MTHGSRRLRSHATNLKGESTAVRDTHTQERANTFSDTHRRTTFINTISPPVVACHQRANATRFQDNIACGGGLYLIMGIGNGGSLPASRTAALGRVSTTTGIGVQNGYKAQSDIQGRFPVACRRAPTSRQRVNCECFERRLELSISLCEQYTDTTAVESEPTECSLSGRRGVSAAAEAERIPGRHQHVAKEKQRGMGIVMDISKYNPHR